MQIKIAVVGAGAAGLMAAGTAAANRAEVSLFEKNEKPGRKLAITGKGRCNLTNNCTPDEFLKNVPVNPKFLNSALYAFSPQDAMTLFESLGVPLKTERGNRVFPCSDRAFDIVDALKKYAGKSRFEHDTVRAVSPLPDGRFSVKTDAKTQTFDRLILATGGLSYPQTGSTGDGYAFARSLGHTVTPLSPSLVPLVCRERFCPALQGLSLRNTALRVIEADTQKTVCEDFGEMLFTHYGVSGPMILSASAHMRGLPDVRYQIILDLKPALDEKMLDDRILADFSENKNRDFINALDALLPKKLIPVVVSLSGIPPHKKVNAVTRAERLALRTLLKAFPITPVRFRPTAEAIVTSGGVSVAEINPKTMESKLVPGLYFAGELLDLDAYTGGFNLQIAFSTGYAAGKAAASEKGGNP